VTGCLKGKWATQEEKDQDLEKANNAEGDGLAVEQ
jgi:hypothetical protein